MSSSVWKADKAFSNVQFFNFIAAGEQLGSRVRETNSDDEDENMASDDDDNVFSKLEPLSSPTASPIYNEKAPIILAGGYSFEDFIRQVQTEAMAVCSTQTSAEPTSSLLSLADVHFENESDGECRYSLRESDSSVTHATPTSPCPRNRSTRRQTGGTKLHFAANRGWNNKAFKNRRPLLVELKSKVSPKVGIKNKTALQSLREIEYGKTHRWLPHQTALLCALHRWYGGVSDNSTLVKIFNSVTGLGLSERKVTNRFKNHLLLHGSPIKEFRQVFLETPFQDPEGKYDELRSAIESHAMALGVKILRRSHEGVVISDRAALAKSPKTRRIHRALINKAIKEATSSPLSNSSPTSTQGGRSVTAGDSSKAFIDIETASPALEKGPVLAYRAWDNESQTPFRNGKFVAGLFAGRRNGIVPRTTPPDALWYALALAHLNKKGGTASAFISVGTSLLQVLNYASKKKDPKLGVLSLRDLDEEKFKKHQASTVINALRSMGEMKWTRYRGACETLLWGEAVPFKTLSFSQLIDLAGEAPEVAELLRLDSFTGQSTRSLAQELWERKIVLDHRIARAMGILANLFGLSSPKIICVTEFVAEFSCQLTDGFAIQEAPVGDLHAMRDLGLFFALAMGIQPSSNHFDKVITGWISGVCRGTQNLEYTYSRRRRPKHQRSNS